MPIAEAIALLRAVIRSPDCSKMNLSTVKGYLGELLVKQKLETELGPVKVEHFGNQCGFDLQYVLNGKSVTIDVKTSTAKDERRWGFRYWSWALLTDTKKKLTATHFVCAGLNEMLDLQAMFVVVASDLPCFPPDTGQFRNNKHVLFLAQSEPPDTAPGTANYLYLESRHLLRVGKVREVAAHDCLSRACG